MYAVSGATTAFAPSQRNCKCSAVVQAIMIDINSSIEIKTLCRLGVSGLVLTFLWEISVELEWMQTGGGLVREPLTLNTCPFIVTAAFQSPCRETQPILRLAVLNTRCNMCKKWNVQVCITRLYCNIIGESRGFMEISTRTSELDNFKIAGLNR